MSARNNPKIILLLDGENLSISSSTSDRTEHRVVDIPLANFFNRPDDSASTILGEAILQHFRAIAPQSFTQLAQRSPAEMEDAYSRDKIAHHLISLSVSRKTAVFVPAIEHLLAEAALTDSGTKSFLEINWPVLRKRLLDFP